MAAVSVGLAGATPPDTVREVARAAEAAGLRALWLNETPGSDALAGLAVAAEATERLLLGVGVVPIDRFPPDVIAGRVERAGIPAARLMLGIGSGRAPHPAVAVAEAVHALRGRLETPILVGGLGPRVRRVGAELADGLLLNWLSPAASAAARDEAVAQAEAADRPRPHVALYARTAVEAAAHAALREEASRYASFPGYRENFERLGEDPLDGSILAASPAELREGVARYAAAVDELVLRAVTEHGTAAEIRRIVDAATGP